MAIAFTYRPRPTGRGSSLLALRNKGIAGQSSRQRRYVGADLGCGAGVKVLEEIGEVVCSKRGRVDLCRKRFKESVVLCVSRCR